ncbi:MAG: LysE family translocator [Pseudonocardiaceae bacterium]
MIATLLAYSLAVLVGSMVPGATTAVLMRQTLRGGRRAGIWTLVGNETGVLLWGLGAALGLSGLMAASPLAYNTLRVVGALVLVYLGARALWESRHRPAPAAEPVEETQLTSTAPACDSRRWHNYRIGLLTIVTNPKYAIFAVSFLPQFVPTGAPPLPMLLLLAALWVIVDSGWFLGVIWFIHQLRRFLAQSRVRHWLERITGGVLISLGLRLITQPL